MTTKADLIGLGIPSQPALRLGRTPILVTAQGTTMGDARVIGATEYDPIVATGTGGIVLRSPGSVASSDALGSPLLGDQFFVTNITAASISLFVRNATIYVNGVSVSGSLGLSVGIGQSCIARAISATTWNVIGSVLSN